MDFSFSITEPIDLLLNSQLTAVSGNALNFPDAQLNYTFSKHNQYIV